MKSFLFFVFCLFFSAGLFAVELSTVFYHLEQNEARTELIQFDYNQHISFLAMQSSTTVSGSAIFGKGGKLRISKSKPDQQILVSDGKKLNLYNPQFNQVWSGTWTGWTKNALLPKGMVPLDNYVSELKKNFHLAVAENSPEGLILLRARPKQDSLDYEMELYFSSQSWLLERTLYRSESAVIETRLTNIQVNPSVAPYFYKLDFPSDAELIPLN